MGIHKAAQKQSPADNAPKSGDRGDRQAHWPSCTGKNPLNNAANLRQIFQPPFLSAEESEGTGSSRQARMQVLEDKCFLLSVLPVLYSSQ